MRTLLVLIALLAASPALAQNIGIQVRGGGSLTGYTEFVQLLDPLTNGRLENANVDLIWDPPINPLFLIFSPGLEVGATSNFGSGESFAHANLLWRTWVPLAPVFFEGGLGAAVLLNTPTTGCQVLPYATAGVGVALGDNWTVSVGVEHLRDFGLCDKTTKEVTTLGAQLGISF